MKVMENGKYAYGLCEFRCTYEEEIKTLPTNCLIGSTAFIIENGKVYMLGDKGWEEI